MPPGLPPTPADKALREEARWVLYILGGMGWCLVEGAGVLAGVFQPAFLAGGGIVLILTTLVWLLRAPARWLMGRMMIAHMMTLDILDQSLQRCLRRQAIRRRGSLGSGPTSSGSSGSTFPGRPDDRNGDDG